MTQPINQATAVHTSDIIISNIHEWEMEMESYILKLEDATHRSELLKIIRENYYDVILSRFLQYGDELENVLWENHQELAKELKLMHHDFAFQIKKLSILHRDIHFNLNRNELIENDYNYKQENLVDHFHRSKESLLKALSFVRNRMVQSRHTVESAGSKKDVLIFLRNVESPWNSYKSQLQTIQEQVLFIDESHHKMLSVFDRFASLKTVFKNVRGQLFHLADHYIESIDHIASRIEENQLENLSAFIDRTLEKGHASGNAQRSNQISLQIKEIADNLLLDKVPVGVEGGSLQIRELYLGSTVKKWLDFEVFPIMADLYLIEENLKLNVHLKLNQFQKVLNGITVESNEEFEPLHSIHDSITESKARAENLYSEISDKMESALQVQAIYTSNSFLNVPVAQAQSVHEDVQERGFRGRLRKLLTRLNSWFKSQAIEMERTPLQLGTLVISSRMKNAELGQYDSLFLNRNFIGDLFYIPREIQERLFMETYSIWNEGFAKAILITGNPASGKTTFASQMVKGISNKNLIIIKPASSITLNGRKFDTAQNLVEVLDFLRASKSGTEKSIILIDDLERWRDVKNRILSNVKALMRFIEEESQHYLVVVTGSEIFVNFVNARFRFSELFAAEISMNTASKAEVTAAVLIRHETAHKVLKDENNDVLTNADIQKIAWSQAQQRNQNLGNTLQAWAFNTILKDDNDVVFEKEQLRFVTFFTNEERMVLKQLLLFKIISERTLKADTGSAFESKYKSALRRLINTRVLLRNLDGNLYLNPVVSFEIVQYYYKNHKSA